jgi:hypothetical protein
MNTYANRKMASYNYSSNFEKHTMELYYVTIAKCYAFINLEFTSKIPIKIT